MKKILTFILLTTTISAFASGTIELSKEDSTTVMDAINKQVKLDVDSEFQGVLKCKTIVTSSCPACDDIIYVPSCSIQPIQ